MADGLAEALAGLKVSPAENPYGIASMGLASAAPNLITPYTSPGAAVGIGLGSVLLQSLLGYQARQSALQDTIQANSLANQMLKMQTPEERTSFLGGLDVSPDIGGRLSTLSLALSQQEQARKTAAANKLLELETAANFELGDLGQQLQKNKLKQAALTAGIAAGRIPTEYADMFAPVATPNLETTGLDPELAAAIKQLPADKQQQALVDALEKKAAQSGSEGAKQQRNAVETVRDLEETFRKLNMTAAEFKSRSSIPGDPAELAFSKLKGSLAALARVSGQTSQLSDVDLRQQMDSILGPTAPMIGMISGTDSIAARLKEKLKTGERLAQQQTSGIATESEAQKRNRELKQRLANLEALAAQKAK